MFARTQRLLLRPGFIEDAAELTQAVADERIARNLASLPWPYAEDDARAWLMSDVANPHLPTTLITQRTSAGSRIVGGIGIHLTADALGNKRPEIGYWIARPYWGLGFATEAGRAVVAYARAIGMPQLISGHFVDNPASGRVLRKLGFRPTGQIVKRFSLGRGEDVACVLFEQGDEPVTDVPPRTRFDEDARELIRLKAA
jgi:RimJ/RimL family protein N-acetyltransferase